MRAEKIQLVVFVPVLVGDVKDLSISRIRSKVDRECTIGGKDELLELGGTISRSNGFLPDQQCPCQIAYKGKLAVITESGEHGGADIDMGRNGKFHVEQKSGDAVNSSRA